MGEVWRAYDTVRHREVALKRLQPHLADNRQFQARFRREAALAAQLNEPHVIPIHDYGEIDGRLYIDMRLVEGIGLNTLLAVHGRLPAARAVHIVSQTAGALAAAHGAGLVHRDVKPSNVLLTDRVEPGTDFVYLVDFGVAHNRDATVLTSTGFTVGTLAYMAPERFDGRGDHRADVYALGCLLYEALTAVPPFSGEGLPALVKAHLSAPPPRPSVACRDLPAALDEVVATAMAKDPSDRYPSATELAAAARAAIVPSVVGARRGCDRAPGPRPGPAPTTARRAPAGHRWSGTARPPLPPGAGRATPVGPAPMDKVPGRSRPEIPAARRPAPGRETPTGPRPERPSPPAPAPAGSPAGGSPVAKPPVAKPPVAKPPAAGRPVAGPPPAGLGGGRRPAPAPKSKRRSTPLVLLLVGLALLAVLSLLRDHGDRSGHPGRPERWEHGSSSHRH